jgi:hypothetical protein
MNDIAAVITDLYAAYGDRDRFDTHLLPELTIWESDAPTMLRGLAELDTLRDSRAPAVDAAPLTSLRPEELLVDAWRDTGVARYLLRATYADPDRADQLFRVTDVLRHDGGRWRIVHHHAEALDS